MPTINEHSILNLDESVEYDSGSDSDSNYNETVQTKYVTENHMNDLFKFKNLSSINIYI